MLIKKKGGFVFVVLALFIFSGLFVSGVEVTVFSGSQSISGSGTEFIINLSNQGYVFSGDSVSWESKLYFSDNLASSCHALNLYFCGSSGNCKSLGVIDKNGNWGTATSITTLPLLYYIKLVPSVKIAGCGIPVVTLQYFKVTGTQSSVSVGPGPTPTPGIVTPDSNSQSCFIKCAVNNTGMVSAPHISVAPPSCYFNESCETNITLVRGQNSIGYDLVWVYQYSDGTNRSVCACNGSETVEGKKVRINSVTSSYSLPVFINDSYGKMIDSVQLFAYSFNGTNRSSVNTGSANININYKCESECDVLGKKVSWSSYVEGETNQYATCVKLPGNICFNWSGPTTCELGYIFNGSSQSCERVLGLTVNCTGVSRFCVRLVQDELGNSIAYNEQEDELSLGSVSLSYSNEQPNLKCALSTTKCYECAEGYYYNATRGRCVKTNCNNNCTSVGGVCSDLDISDISLTPNSNYTCCTDESCYICASGYHVFNNTCVSDNCTNLLGHYPTGVNFTVGANISNSSSTVMEWNYLSGSVGACQWNCSLGYELNISTNNTCQPIVKVNCTQNVSKYICSNVPLVSNAFNNSQFGFCEGDKSCFACNANATLKDGVCVPKSCEDDNQINNGIECVDNINCTDGCIIKKNGNEWCMSNGFRLNVNSGSKYCDINDHTFKSLLENNMACSFNSQCKTNLCLNSTCVDLLDKVSTARKFLIQITCWARNGFSFSSDNYHSCESSGAAQYIKEN